MTQDDDAPLLRWSPMAAEVIPFPSRARVGKIRRTARQIDQGTDKSGAAYWRRTVADMQRQMAQAGVPVERIAQEMEAFFDAVQGEVDHHAHVGARRRPDGDDAP